MRAHRTRRHGFSASFLNFNRNKRSVTTDRKNGKVVKLLKLVHVLK